METLKLEHIAPYLIHNLRVNIYKLNGELYICNEPFLDFNPCFSGPDVHIISNGSTKYIFYLESIKPIFHPLSSLTKPIQHNGEEFVPLDKLYEINGSIDYADGTLYSEDGSMGHYEWISVNKKLYEWRFAVDIPDHLWIDVNTLEENPYK